MEAVDFQTDLDIRYFYSETRRDIFEKLVG